MEELAARRTSPAGHAVLLHLSRGLRDRLTVGMDLRNRLGSIVRLGSVVRLRTVVRLGSVVRLGTGGVHRGVLLWGHLPAPAARGLWRDLSARWLGVVEVVADIVSRSLAIAERQQLIVAEIRVAFDAVQLVEVVVIRVLEGGGSGRYVLPV